MRLARCAYIGFAIQIASLYLPSVCATAQTTLQAKKSVVVNAQVLDSDVGKYQLDPRMIAVAHTGDHLESVLPGISRLEFPPQPAGEALKAECARIDSFVAAAFAKQPYGSVTVGVVSGKELFWTKSYGDADMEKKTPADKDTIYRIGSITKMFTALMLEQLADSATVHLSDPVEKYVPEIKAVTGRYVGASPITLIQLATHTSGLGREPANVKIYMTGSVADWEKTELLALRDTHYIAEPGTVYSYSNIGYATLGLALERATGKPYLAYVPAHIFVPLDMTHTSLDATPDMLPHLSKGYDVDGAPDASNSVKELKGRGYKVPNGAIFTTVGDLAHFASFLMGEGPDNVLTTASLKRYQRQYVVPSSADLKNGYGIGFFVARRNNYVAFGHDGAVSGYRSALYVNMNAKLGIIVLSSAIGPRAIDADDLALKSLDLLSTN